MSSNPRYPQISSHHPCQSEERITRDRFAKLEQQLSYIVQRIELIEGRHQNRQNPIEVINQRVTLERQPSLAEEFADNVNSLIGLKEMVSSRHRPIRFAWAGLLIVGLLATAYFIYATTIEYLDHPTATTVELRRPQMYDYPDLVLCPGVESWLDERQAQRLGLSEDGQRYSKGYFMQVPPPFNHTTEAAEGKRNFHTVYRNLNFTSLFNFYANISHQFTVFEFFDDFQRFSGPSIYTGCPGCVGNTSVDTVMINREICFAISMKSVAATLFRQWQYAPSVYALFPGVNIRWNAYLTPDKRILQTNYPEIPLAPYTYTILQLSEQKFVTLHNDHADCSVQSAEPPSTGSGGGYSAERCILECLNQFIAKRSNCSLIYMAAEQRYAPIESYCNYYDEDTPRNASTLFTSEERWACLDRCPFPCDRKIYTTSMHSTIPMEGEFVEKIIRDSNMTLIQVVIDNTAIWHGGVLTVSEVKTFSFTTLISNVGGTLGLFVGGTVFTFFQLVLWMIHRCLDQRHA